MPHLSPMSWFLVMPLLWVTLILFMSTSFFTVMPQFLTPRMRVSQAHKTLWSWTLQDGRD